MTKCENACPFRRFEGCCHKCPEFSTCPGSCEETPNECGQAIFDEETALQEFKNSQLATLNAIADLTARKQATFIVGESLMINCSNSTLERVKFRASPKSEVSTA